MPKYCNAPEDCPFEAEKVAHIYSREGYTAHLHRYLRNSPMRLVMLIGALRQHDAALASRLQRDIDRAARHGAPKPHTSRVAAIRPFERATGAPVQ